jgi:hypothetical protein
MYDDDNDRMYDDDNDDERAMKRVSYICTCFSES